MTDERNSLTTRHLWASVLLATIGLLYYQVMPLYLGGLQDHLGITTTEIGYIGSIYFLGMTVCSASSYFWVRSVNPRVFSFLAMCVLVVLFWFTSVLSGFYVLLVMMLGIGVVSGALTSIGVTIAGDSEEPARWYGIQVAAEAAAGVLLLLLMPVTLMAMYGFTGLIWGMLMLLVALAVPTTIWLPSREMSDKQTDSIAAGQPPVLGREAPRKAVWSSLIAMVLLFVGSASIWAFVERIATRNEYSAEATGLVLSIAICFSVVGSLSVSVLVSKLELVLLYTLCTALLIAGVGTVALFSDIYLFTVGAASFMFGWAAAFAVLFAITAEVDPDGKHITLSVPALGIGSMIGPAVAGTLLESSGTQPLLLMSVGTVALSAILVLNSRKLIYR
jgi:predicted MFS family arabinose efflux permease